MMTRPFTTIAAIIFAIMALLHVYRLFTHFQVVLGSHVIPQSASYAAILVAGALAIGLFRESRR
jgi:lipopolysaccharide export LptBFGC system permease protein LptF